MLVFILHVSLSFTLTHQSSSVPSGHTGTAYMTNGFIIIIVLACDVLCGLTLCFAVMMAGLKLFFM